MRCHPYSIRVLSCLPLSLIGSWLPSTGALTVGKETTTTSGTWPPATPPPYHLLPPGHSCMCPAIAIHIAHAKGGCESAGRGTYVRRRSSVVAWNLISGIHSACSLPPIYLVTSSLGIRLVHRWRQPSTRYSYRPSMIWRGTLGNGLPLRPVHGAGKPSRTPTVHHWQGLIVPVLLLPVAPCIENI